jgi:hypothetical protein
VYFVHVATVTRKLSGVFVRFRAPLHPPVDFSYKERKYLMEIVILNTEYTEYR